MSPRARARFDHRTRIALALELCKDPLLDVLIDGDSAFENLAETMPLLAAPAGGELGPGAERLVAMRITLHESHVAWAA